MAVAVPAGLRSVLGRTEEGCAWLAALPATVAELEKRWALRLGEPFEPGGWTAWVAPARDADGRDLVLKVGAVHEEGLHEAEGLIAWRGGPVVVVHQVARLPGTVALLLERCRPGVALREAVAEPDQDVVVTGLLRRLHRAPVDGPFRPLRLLCDQWAAEFRDRPMAQSGQPVDPGLARAGVELFTALPRTGAQQALLCTDLHAGNILAARREPWLVIDPKPYVGDPCYDVLQHALNCPERLHRDPRGLVRRLADLAALDAERLQQWLFARCVVGSSLQPDLVGPARLLAA